MLVFCDILKKLSDAGWSSYRLRTEKLLSESTLTRLRNGGHISTATIETICQLCNCQPGDLMHHVPDDQGE